MPPRVLILSCSVLFSVLQGCGPTGPERGCRQRRLNPKLQHVFYWGDFGFPNRGPAVGGIDSPVWTAPGRICVSTGYWNENDPVQGIFAIDFAPWGTEHSFIYRNFSVLESQHRFWTLVRGSEEDQILFIGIDANGSRAGSVVFNDPNSERELVGADWQPWGIGAWPGRPGIVFYGRDPSSGVDGFYWRVPEVRGPLADSLLYAITLSRSAARGMAIDHEGRNLYFSTEVSRRVQFLKLPLDGSGEAPIVMMDRAGGAGAIHPNPRRADLVLIQYSFGGDATNPPQSHIELLNVATSQATDLEVRTEESECMFVVNDHASWSPDGNHFAFAAGGFSGEGDRSPLTLWIYNDAAFER